MTELIIQSPKTIYDVIANLDETAKLFTLYPPIQEACREIIHDTKIQAAALIKETEEGYFKFDPTRELNNDTRLNRLAFLVFSKQLTPSKLQSSLEDYNYQETPFSSRVVSWIPGAHLATSFFSSKSRPLSCALEPAKQEPAEFVICKQVTAFFAEKEVAKLAEQPRNFPQTTHLNPDILKNLGAFVVATEEDKVALTISPDKLRDLWKKNYRSEFCKSKDMTPNKKTICKDRRRSSLSLDYDWKEVLTAQLSSLPSKFSAEIYEALNSQTRKNSSNNDEL